MIKSHLQGRDEKERWKEVMLEEHTECGCGCAFASAEQCVDRFNPQRCECECSALVWGAEREACKERAGHHWDERFCVCRSDNKVRHLSVSLIQSVLVLNEGNIYCAVKLLSSYLYYNEPTHRIKLRISAPSPGNILPLQLQIEINIFSSVLIKSVDDVVVQVVTTRQVEERSVSDCPFPSYRESYRLDLLDIASYIILGSSATLAFFLSITTYYYRRWLSLFYNNS